ncbi:MULTISPECIES: efflux RND transporter permease subunit [Methylobacterium]|uniref:Cobalt-zinc-cadmium resistance protein CzcA n=1 Tax=Methylobacterium thuringiense TaxID=1003091 RepID=A0ABQ4TH95_9HYPH|nr:MULTISPECIES: efflux RND transporter permease subunit [Methylobacterium]TXN24866.1 efflux RND transporter permease subunit [Methylobacterium sp. WL9]GJE54321.1 Cobalt-zinc-cadmium resistance protein CzcA [Methylobacterium thuringiense]
MIRDPSGPQAALVAFAVRRPGIVLALAMALAVYGILGLGQAKYDVFPEFAPPTVTVQTEAPGFNPEQVEVLVTQAVEVALSGLPGLATMRSNSIQGVSVITVTFGTGSDIYRVRQLVTERLATLSGRLPQGVLQPSMTALTSSTSSVLLVGLTSDSRSPIDLRTIADWRVRLRLLAAPGVGEVLVYGGEVRSFQVQVRPKDLIRFRIGLNDVLVAARKATGVRGAGFVDTVNQRIALQTEGQSLTPEEVARTVLVNEGGASVVLGDVADVVTAPEPAISGASVDGKAGVLLMVGAQYGANTLDVTEKVETALAELRPALERDGITLRADLFRPANFVSVANANVLQALALGGVLVVIVLFVFLLDWRTALISAVAIPLSLISAVLVLRLLGESLNTMTLGGLAIAIGEVVDDAVIGVENVVRRLREHRRTGSSSSESRIILDAILEVRISVAYATFAVLLVFLPVLALTGVPGRLFGPLAIAYILAVLASLVTALTVTPALSRLLLAGRKNLPTRDPPVMRGARAVYMRCLSRIDRHPRLMITVALLATLAGAAAAPFYGSAFLPDLKEGHLILHMASAPGTSLQESLRLGGHIATGLKAIPGVRAVAQQVGRAEAGYDVGGPQDSEIHIDLERGLDGTAQDRAQAGIRALMAATPGASFSLKTFLTERIEETVSGFTAPVVVQVYGSDLDRIEAASRDVARELAEVRGAADVQQKSPAGLPQINVGLRPNDLRHWGLDAIEVLEIVRTAYQGDTVGQAYEGNAVFNVIVILERAARAKLSTVGDLPLRTPSGSYIRLAQVADVYETSGRYAVQHSGAQRVRTVTANVEGRDVASFVAAAKRKIGRSVKLPPGVYVGFEGAAEAQAQARQDLILYSGLAGLGILLLLAIVTGSLRNLAIVLVNMPFAFVGGVLAVGLTGTVVSLGSIVGFVTLFGISLRNTIMMVAHYEHLVRAEGRDWTLATAIEGAADRLVPILMTSLVTGLGLLPLALGAGEPGREIEGPMAIVILGGLATSTILNLSIVPTLALHYGRFTTAKDA